MVADMAIKFEVQSLYDFYLGCLQEARVYANNYPLSILVLNLGKEEVENTRAALFNSHLAFLISQRDK